MKIKELLGLARRNPPPPPVPMVTLERTADWPLDTPDVAEPVARYIAEGMEQIDGWGVNQFLARILIMLDAWQDSRGARGNLFELGVHEGRMSILLALLAKPGQKTVLVDLFEDRQDENIDNSGHGNRVRLDENLARWCPEAALEIVQANSLELDFTAVPELAAGVRLAHVDGGHHLDAVLNDFAKTEAVLTDDGILIVDDFMHTGFPEVNEGCHIYFAGETRLRPVAMGQDKLILTRSADVAELIAYLSARMDPPYGKPVRFRGHPCICLDHH